MVITSAANTGKLSGLTLFITGATRGVGKALALKAAKDGANVVIAARTTVAQSKLRNDTIYTVADEVEKAGGRAYPIAMDLRSESDIRAAIEQTAAKVRGGVIDIVVNNASVVSLSRALETSVDRFDLMHQVNTRGTYLVSQLCLPHLKRSKQPQILNMCPPLSVNPAYLTNHLPIWLPAPNGCPQKDFTKCRKPEFVADAAYLALTREPKQTGKFYLCEDLFKEAGVHDLSAYDMKPGNLLVKELFIDEQQSPLQATREPSQSKAAIAPIETVADAFDRLGSILGEFAARNKLKARFMFRLSSDSDTYNWFLEINPNGCSHGRALAISGPSYLPADVEFRMDSRDFLRLCNGELQLEEAFASGKLNAFGSSDLTQRFKDILQFLRESSERKAEKSPEISSPINSDCSAAPRHCTFSEAIEVAAERQEKAERYDSAIEAIELFHREARSLTSSIATLKATLSSQNAISSASVASHVETIKRHFEDQLAKLKSDLVASTTASSKESHRQLQALMEKLDSLKQLDAQLARLTPVVQTESTKQPEKSPQFTRDELKRMCNDVADAYILVNQRAFEEAVASNVIEADKSRLGKAADSLGDLLKRLSRIAEMQADQSIAQSDRLEALESQLSGQIEALSGKLDSVVQNNPRVSVVETASSKEATEKLSADLRKLLMDVAGIVTNLKQLSADVGVRTASGSDYDSAESESGSESDGSSYSSSEEEESLSEQISDLSSEITKLRSEVKAIAASIGGLTQDDSSNEGDGSSSSSEDEQRASIMAKLNELSKAIEEMDFDALSDKVDKLQEDVGVKDLTEAVDTLAEKVDEAADDISDKLDSLTETVEEGWKNEGLEAKVEDVSTELEKLADKISDLDIENISDKIDQLSDKVDGLLPEDLENAVRDLSEKIEPLEDVAELISQLSARMDRTESSKLEAKLNALGRQIAALEESVDHSSGRVVNVSAEVAALSAAIGRNSSLSGGAKPPGDHGAGSAEIGADPTKMAPSIGLLEKRLEAVIQKQSSDSRKQSDSMTKKLIAMVLIGAAAGGFYLNRTVDQMKRNSDSAATEAAKAALIEFVAKGEVVEGKKTDGGHGLDGDQLKEELNDGLFSALMGTGLLGVVVLIAALL